jgi:hypothetical protein
MCEPELLKLFFGLYTKNFKKINMNKCESLIDTFEKKSDKLRALKALNFSTKAHSFQKRKTGELYINHPIEVATRFWSMFKDADCFIAGLLHDTVEDSKDITIKDIYKEFGDNIGFMVDSLTKTTHEFYDKSFNKNNSLSYIDKLLIGGLKDVRVLVLKLLDRQHNLETIGVFSEKKQVRLSFETQVIYKPLSFLLESSSLEECKDLLKKYLIENKISSEDNFKDFLYNTSFKHDKNEDFITLTSNSEKIIWEINDKFFYLELCKNNSFVNSHEIITMEESEKNDFKVEFQFTKSFSWGKGKIKIARFQTL